MRDQPPDRRLDELIESWTRYRDTVIEHAGRPMATPEEERRFLELKGLIAAALPMLSGAFPAGSLNHELQQNIRGMSELLNRYVRLSGSGAPSEENHDEFMSRWQGHYLYLQRFKVLEKSHTSPTRAQVPVSGLPVAARGRSIKGVFDHDLVRFVVKAVVVLGLILVATRVLGVDLRKAPPWLGRTYHELWRPEPPAPVTSEVTPPAGKDAPAPAPRAAAARKDQVVRLGGVKSDAKYSVDGSGEFRPPGTPEGLRKVKEVARRITPVPLRHYFSSLVQLYSLEMTLTMLGVLFLLVTYMVFGRGK